MIAQILQAVQMIVEVVLFFAALIFSVILGLGISAVIIFICLLPFIIIKDFLTGQHKQNKP
jgi:hypothetical protein